jgi:hypothetical protein
VGPCLCSTYRVQIIHDAENMTVGDSLNVA